MNKYRIVTQDENNAMTIVEFTFCSVTPDVARKRFILAVQRMGYGHTGDNNNPRQREELQGQPKFNGLLGAMWDGDAIRYEDQNAYETLSA